MAELLPEQHFIHFTEKKNNQSAVILGPHCHLLVESGINLRWILNASNFFYLRFRRSGVLFLNLLIKMIFLCVCVYYILHFGTLNERHVGESCITVCSLRDKRKTLNRHCVV